MPVASSDNQNSNNKIWLFINQAVVLDSQIRAICASGHGFAERCKAVAYAASGRRSQSVACAPGAHACDMRTYQKDLAKMRIGVRKSSKSKFLPKVSSFISCTLC